MTDSGGGSRAGDGEDLEGYGRRCERYGEPETVEETSDVEEKRERAFRSGHIRKRDKQKKTQTWVYILFGQISFCN